MRLAFRPAEHLRKRTDFERIYRTGSRQSGRLMTVFAQSTSQDVARLGIAATRKFGQSVERNRAKRLIREVFRHQKPASGVDVVVVPRRVILEAPYATIEAEFRSLLDRWDRFGKASNVARR